MGAYVAAGMSILSTGLGVVGQIQQANAQASQAQYAAQVARNNQMMAQYNAQVLQEQARYAEQRGQAAEQQQRYQTSSLIGKQRAALASQGGDIDSGSPVDIVGDTAAQGELGARNIESDTVQQKFNLLSQAQNAQLQADNAGLQSDSAANQASSILAGLPFGVGGSLLSGGGRIYDIGAKPSVGWWK